MDETNEKIAINKNNYLTIQNFLLSLRLSQTDVVEYSNKLCDNGYDDMESFLHDITLHDFSEACIKRGHIIRIVKGLIDLIDNGIDVKKDNSKMTEEEEIDCDDQANILSSKLAETLLLRCFKKNTDNDEFIKSTNDVSIPSQKECYFVYYKSNDEISTYVKTLIRILSSWGFHLVPRNSNLSYVFSDDAVKESSADLRSPEIIDLLSGLRLGLKRAYNSLRSYLFDEYSVNKATCNVSKSNDERITNYNMKETEEEGIGCDDQTKAVETTIDYKHFEVLVKQFNIVAILFETVLRWRIGRVNEFSIFSDVEKQKILQFENIDNNYLVIADLSSKLTDLINVMEVPKMDAAIYKRIFGCFDTIHINYVHVLKQNSIAFLTPQGNPLYPELENSNDSFSLSDLVHFFAVADYSSEIKCLNDSSSDGFLPSPTFETPKIALNVPTVIEAIPLKEFTTMIDHLSHDQTLSPVVKRLQNVTGAMQSNMVIIGPIGRGSSATVYKGLYLPTMEIFAVKYMDLQRPLRKKQLFNEFKSLCILGEKIENEYKSLENVNIKAQQKHSQYVAVLSSPYIVNFYDVYYDVSEDHVCLVLEYMSGSLQDFLDLNKRASERSVSAISYYLLNAFAALHANKFIHRDVKPGNVLINCKGNIMLSDFGITTILCDENDTANTFTGTFRYMSPERLRGESYSYESDIWSFGMTMLTILIGKTPYGDKTINSYWRLNEEVNSNYFHFNMQDIRQLLMDSDNPNDFSDSPLLWDFLQKCLCKEPQLRLTAKQLLAHPFITLHNPPSLFSHASDFLIYNSYLNYSDFHLNNANFSELENSLSTLQHSLRPEIFTKMPIQQPIIAQIRSSLDELVNSIAALDRSVIVTATVLDTLLFYHICHPEIVTAEERCLRLVTLSKHFEKSMSPTDFIRYAKKRVLHISKKLARKKIVPETVDLKQLLVKTATPIDEDWTVSKQSGRRAELQQMLDRLKEQSSFPDHGNTINSRLVTTHTGPPSDNSECDTSKVQLVNSQSLFNKYNGRKSSEESFASAVAPLEVRSEPGVTDAPGKGVTTTLPTPQIARKLMTLPERLRPPIIDTALMPLRSANKIVGDFGISMPYLQDKQQSGSTQSESNVQSAIGDSDIIKQDTESHDSASGTAIEGQCSTGDEDGDGGDGKTDFICTINSPVEKGAPPRFSCRPIDSSSRIVPKEKNQEPNILDGVAARARESPIMQATAGLASTFPLTLTHNKSEGRRHGCSLDSASPELPSFIISLPDKILKKATPLHRIRSTTSLSTLSDCNHNNKSPTEQQLDDECDGSMSLICRPRVTPRAAIQRAETPEGDLEEGSDSREAYCYSVLGSSQCLQISDDEFSPKKIEDDSPLLFF